MELYSFDGTTYILEIQIIWKWLISYPIDPQVKPTRR